MNDPAGKGDELTWALFGKLKCPLFRVLLLMMLVYLGILWFSVCFVVLWVSVTETRPFRDALATTSHTQRKREEGPKRLQCQWISGNGIGGGVIRAPGPIPGMVLV